MIGQMTNLLASKLCLNCRPIALNSVRGRKLWPIPPDLSKIELPPEDERQLIAIEPTPDWHGVRPRKYPKEMANVRGPELVNNQLIHKQFGIIALTGVQLTINHINMIRTTINKNLDTRKMFAIWRIEPPWKPVSRKGQGKRHGGGKGSIHHYVTPIRAGHVIVEIGGQIVFEDCFHFLENAARKLPCDAFPVSQEILDEWEKEENSLAEANINPYSFERVIKYNMQGTQSWISPYEKLWYGKYY